MLPGCRGARALKKGPLELRLRLLKKGRCPGGPSGSSSCRQGKMPSQPDEAPRARVLRPLSGALSWHKSGARRQRTNVLRRLPFLEKQHSRAVNEKLATPWNFFIKFPLRVPNILDIPQTRAFILKTLKDRTEKLAPDVSFRVSSGNKQDFHSLLLLLFYYSF